MKKIFLLIAILICACSLIPAKAQTITTVAGGDIGDGGPAPAALIKNPYGIAMDASGNVYIADFTSNLIRKVSTGGIITTVAGNGSGGFTGDGSPATLASLSNPTGVAVDGSGNIYIADQSNNRIRKVNTLGIISTIAGTGGPGYSGDGVLATSAELYNPHDVAVDVSGNVYISDASNYRIRKVNTLGIITTVAGNGSGGYSGDGIAATTTSLWLPQGIALDGSGYIYIADYYNSRIRKVNVSGIITTIAGSATAGYSGDERAATIAEIYEPNGVTVDVSGNIYIADLSNAVVRKINPSGIITTLAGNGSAGYSGDGGSATAAELKYPLDVAADASGNVYIAVGGDGSFDDEDHRIRKVNTSGVITTFAGTGSSTFSGDGDLADNAALDNPFNLIADGSGNIYFSDASNNRIRKLSTSGIITTVAGTGVSGFSGDGGAATAAQLATPAGLTFDGSGNLYIADKENNCIRKVSATGVMSTVAGTAGTLGYSGDGTQATNAKLAMPSDVKFDASGNLYIADFGNGAVRKINTSGIITTIAGNGTRSYSGDGGLATAAQLSSPVSLAFDVSGNLYISDNDWPLFSNSRIRKVNTAGIITTFAGIYSLGTFGGDGGPATAATLYAPNGIVFDASGNLYIADAGNNRIRRVNVSGIISTVTGAGGAGFGGDGGLATTAILSGATGVVFNSLGNMFIADNGNSRIREVLNFPLAFTGGPSISLTVCESAAPTSVNTLMTINDPIAGHTDTWSVISGPVHGTLTGFSYSAISTVGTNTPTSMFYTPGAGFSGSDAFTIRVTDGIGDTAITTVNVTITALTAGTITGLSTACPGTTAALADGVSSGVWSSSNTAVASVSAGGVVTGVAIGSATISFTVTTSCGTAIATSPFTVSATPTAGTITGTATTVCEGANISFTDPVTGGVWGSSNTAVASISSPGVVTGVAGGSATISYTVAGGCGSAYATTLVTVTPLPTAGVISGPAGVCLGATASLSETVTGGVWSSSSPAIATVNATGVVTGITAGTAAIIYTITSGCTNFTSHTLTSGRGVLPPSSITPGSGSLCTVAYVNMFVTTTATSLDFQWYKNGIAIAGATDVGYTATAAGDYFVVISNGCGTDTLAAVAVTAAPHPLITTTGSNILYTGTFAAYQWYLNGVAISGANSSIYTYTLPGVYTVKVTDSHGCSGTSVAYTVTGSISGISETSATDIQIYPNPLSTIVHIKAPAKINVTILNMVGQVVLEQQNATDINMSGMANGIYIIKVYDENNVILKTEKLVKAE